MGLKFPFGEGSGRGYEATDASVLVVAAHPDDETLGAGGSIARWISEGADVGILVLGEGSTSRRGYSASDREEQVGDLVRAAVGLGVEERNVTQLSLPDNRFDSVDQLEIVSIVEDSIARHRPSTVLTHHPGDANVDHRCVHRAVVSATRPAVSPVRSVMAFEVLSSTEWGFDGAVPFAPNIFVDISATLSQKVRALSEYRGELREAPHPRSVEAVRALATYRGSTIGVRAAEAFMLVRTRA